MQERGGFGPRVPSPRTRTRPRTRLLPPLRPTMRELVLAGMAAAAIAAALLSAPRSGVGGAVVPGGGTAAPVEGQRSPAHAATAVPTATPSAIRPLAIPTAAPLAPTAPPPVRKPGAVDPDPSTNHVAVIDGDSGAVLFQRNGSAPVAPASLTKIMTAILGIEYGNISEHVRVDIDARSLPDSTVMGLEPWFDITVQDLLYGLMLPSGNDAALAIARYVSGSDNAFVTLMNQKAAWLGLRSTHFANPHGLDAPDHYSSPQDMVTLARYGMKYQTFRELAAARRYDIRESNISYTIENLNPLLWAYPGADGVKIGYTENAGRAIVATAARGGHRVYVAFMRSQAGLVPDATTLLDWAFSSFSWP